MNKDTQSASSCLYYATDLFLEFQCSIKSNGLKLEQEECVCVYKNVISEEEIVNSSEIKVFQKWQFEIYDLCLFLNNYS